MPDPTAGTTSVTGISSPCRRELREGGGVLVLVGLPLAALGLALVLAAAGVLPVRGAPGHRWFLGLLGTPFLALGFALVCGRSRLVLDRGQGLVIRSRSLLVPLGSTTWPLAEVRGVLLDFETGASDRPAAFPVGLLFHGPQPVVRISASRDFGQALAQAKDLCRFLDRPLEDSTGGDLERWTLAELDLPFLDRVSATGVQPAAGPLQTRLQDTSEALTLELPSPWPTRKTATTVRISREGLRVDGRVAGGRQAHATLDLCEIRAITCTTVRGLIAKTRLQGGHPQEPGDGLEARITQAAQGFLEALGGATITVTDSRQCLQFGLGLPEAEVIHLCGVIRAKVRALAGGVPER